MPNFKTLTIAGTTYSAKDPEARDAARAAQEAATAAQEAATAAGKTADTASNKATENAADIAELKANNYLVEVKDTVTENAADNYECHDFKETNHDGTENAVSNFVLAKKQITKVTTDTNAATLTISTIDQTGAEANETLSLPSGGGAAYDDTQVKADIAANTTAIETTNNNVTALTSRVSQNETDITTLKATNGGLNLVDLGTAPTEGTKSIDNLNDYKMLLFIVSPTSDNNIVLTELSPLLASPKYFQFFYGSIYFNVTYGTNEITISNANQISSISISGIK